MSVDGSVLVVGGRRCCYIATALAVFSRSRTAAAGKVAAARDEWRRAPSDGSASASPNSLLSE